MKGYLLLPVIFIKFWFVEAPLGILGYFASLNGAFLELVPLPLFLRTFFKPLKNEYRQGLVLFSRLTGMIVKSFFITISLVFFLGLLAIEAMVLVGFVIFPMMTMLLLYG